MTANTHTQGATTWIPTRDGRRLHAQILGNPSPTAHLPTVIFEAGSGASRSSWATVQQRVAHTARTVVYDRSGLGRSAPDPTSRTLDHMADDLVDLLDHLAPGPFVLVGHSAGGPIVRLAAARRPSLVCGLVLVDPIDEAADVLFSQGFRRNERIAGRLAMLLARMGALRLLFGSLLAAAPADDVRADLRREAFTPTVVATQARQARTFLDEVQQWKIVPPDTGDIPVTVISGALARASEGMPKHVRAQAITAHRKRAAEAPGGRHVIAHESGHAVLQTEPGLIADEIARLIKKSGVPGRSRD